MASSPKTLLTCCVETLRNFADSATTPDAHCQAQLDQFQVAADQDRAFVLEVFNSCLRFRKMLQVVVDGFCAQEGVLFALKDRPLLEVCLYFTILLFDDLGEEGCQSFLKSLSRAQARKVVQFLRYVWSEDNFNGWIKDQWSLLYDRNYIHDRILQPAQRNWAAVAAILDDMDTTLGPSGKLPARVVAKATVPRPFKLTKPTARSLPVPQVVEAAHTQRAVPKTTYRAPIEQAALDRKRRTNRAKAERTARQAAEDPRLAVLASRPTSDRFNQLRETLAAAEEAELRVTTRPRSIPTTNRKRVDVKLNAGAIMREEQLFRAQMRAEAKRLAEVQAGGFDANAFLAWEDNEKEKARQRELEEIEMNHLQGLISREDAILARSNAVGTKNQSVREQKVETEKLMKRYLAEKAKQGQANRQIVEDTAQLYERVYEARVTKNTQNLAAAHEVQNESRTLLEEAKERARKDSERRDAIIMQIRALDMTPVDRSKTVDPTATAGHGFLSEMSFAELQERLNMLKAREAREEENRRHDIAREKDAQDQELKRKMETIALGRAQRVVTQRRRDATQATLKLAAVGKGDRVLELREKLAAKRAATQAARTRVGTKAF